MGGIPGQGHLLFAISQGEGHCCPQLTKPLRTKDAPDLALGAANDLGLTDVRDDLF